MKGISIACAIYPLAGLLMTTTPSEPGFPSVRMWLYLLGFLSFLGVAVLAIPIGWKSQRWKSCVPLVGFAASFTMLCVILMLGASSYNLTMSTPRRDDKSDYWLKLNVGPPTNWNRWLAPTGTVKPQQSMTEHFPDLRTENTQSTDAGSRK